MAVGAFQAPCRVASQGSATTITSADFDGDGSPDLVVPHRDGGQSYVYLNDGTGVFEETRPFGPAHGRNPERPGPATSTGTGLWTLRSSTNEAARRSSSAVRTRRFGSAVPLGDSGATPYAIQVSDLDGDGSPDIIVGHVESRPIAYLNDGAGAFEAVPFGDDEGVAYGFAVADFNEDGVLDIAVARSDARNVLYLGSRGDGAGS